MMYKDSLNFTGHRPDKLNGDTMEDNIRLVRKMDEIIHAYIKFKNKKVFITGMALGVDMWAALIVLKYKKEYPDIKLICAVPFKGQEERFSYSNKKIYNQILSMADEVHIICEGEYAVWKMQVRNEWMVDHAEEILAVWDYTKGGTANCIHYGKKVGRRIYQIHPRLCDLRLLNEGV